MTREAKRRTPNRWGEGGVLREEILVAAARLLTESGREGDLSLRAVAREVGISAPSIYLHFKDRTDLVAEVTRRAYARFIEALQQAREAEDDPRLALQAMAQVYCRFALDNPSYYRLMFGIERVANADAEHPVYQLVQVWDEAVAAYRGGTPDLAENVRVARLLRASLHGIVALAVSVPFPIDRRTMAETADDLLTLALSR